MAGFHAGMDSGGAVLRGSGDCAGIYVGGCLFLGQLSHVGVDWIGDYVSSGVGIILAGSARQSPLQAPIIFNQPRGNIQGPREIDPRSS